MSETQSNNNHKIIKFSKSVPQANYEIDLVYKGIHYPIIRSALSNTMKNLINSKDKTFDLKIPEQIKNPDSAIRYMIVFMNFAYMKGEPKYPLSVEYLTYINTIWPIYSDLFWLAIFYDIHSLQRLITDFSKIYNPHPIRYDNYYRTYIGLY
jgi:hypothetical protein